jgi:hypothetical protein
MEHDKSLSERTQNSYCEAQLNSCIFMAQKKQVAQSA